MNVLTILDRSHAEPGLQSDGPYARKKDERGNHEFRKCQSLLHV